MTEAEWLAATNPTPMLEFLRDRGGASDRKLRLFAVGCCRALWWGVLTDGCGRLAVAASEEFADGMGDEHQMMLAWDTADSLYVSTSVGIDFDDVVLPEEPLPLRGVYAASWANQVDAERAARRVIQVANPEERAKQVLLLRCLFGNPFRPDPALAPSVLAWKGGTVPKLTAAIYDERAFDRLPVLADALEDAGCADADLLGHCRSGGEHARGCWAIDRILGRD